MHINNLGGARMPVTTTANGASQTARTNFGSLVRGSMGEAPGRPALTGSNIVASAISANSGGVSGFGAPYRNLMAAGVPGIGGGTPVQAPTTPAAPAAPTTPGAAAPGSEFNAELQAQAEQQKALVELVKMSMISFINTTFAMGQNRPTASFD